MQRDSSFDSTLNKFYSDMLLFCFKATQIGFFLNPILIYLLFMIHLKGTETSRAYPLSSVGFFFFLSPFTNRIQVPGPLHSGWALMPVLWLEIQKPDR